MPQRRGRIPDGQLLFLLVALGALSALAYARGGGELLARGLGSGGGLLLRYGLVITVSFLAAGIFQELVPSAWVGHNLGRQSGLRGILMATAAGALTPAGPFVSMPLAAVMLRAGAALPAVVAFVAAWSLLAVHRLVAYEVPILGLRFALLRYAVCAGLPVLAGLLTRALVRG